MKKVIVKQESEVMELEELVEQLTLGRARLTVVYEAQSETPYLAYLSVTSHGEYGFRSPIFNHTGMTYRASTVRETLKAAVEGGKRLMVFERDEVPDIFNPKIMKANQ